MHYMLARTSINYYPYHSLTYQFTPITSSISIHIINQNSIQNLSHSKYYLLFSNDSFMNRILLISSVGQTTGRWTAAAIQIGTHSIAEHYSSQQIHNSQIQCNNSLHCNTTYHLISHDEFITTYLTAWKSSLRYCVTKSVQTIYRIYFTLHSLVLRY